LSRIDVAKKQHARSLFRTDEDIRLEGNLRFYKISSLGRLLNNKIQESSINSANSVSIYQRDD
jgi:hypothetical protein